FPISPNAVQTAYGGGTVDYFVTKLSPNGAVQVSTYLGGAGNESGATFFPTFTVNGETLASGSLTAPDATPADNFKPTPAAGQQTFAGGDSDGFGVFYSPDNELKYATYFGSAGTDTGGLAAYGNIHVY
ncbi:hypothetical protein, partial [Clavibacter michiganensis]|uniref:hypothetical protein n=1 Tax=Clavibacter michiganensis TaxID=28447 RepID=UPI00292F4AD7